MMQAKDHIDPLEAMRLRAEAAETATERVKRKLARTLAERDEARAEAAELLERAERAERALAMASLRQLTAREAGQAIAAAHWNTPEQNQRRLARAQRLVDAWKLVNLQGMHQAAAARQTRMMPWELSKFLRGHATALNDLAWSLLESEPGLAAKRPERPASGKTGRPGKG